MNDNAKRWPLSQILHLLADELDVPPSKYRQAKEHYEAVGAWLDSDDSELAPFRPSIYPQGSFALGTAVKPLGDEEYDVDAVCLLQLTPRQVTQQQLKTLVGNRLKHPRSRYKDMIDPREGGRRCWTIRYADASKFHLDVLPAIPDDYSWLLALGVPEEWAKNAICLTDRKTWDDSNSEWPRSNPKGYVSWFMSRMLVRLEEAKRLRATELRMKVEEIQDFDIRTPLQRLIQILKRHRDVRYRGDDDKPISIIITTLAAQAYKNEADLAEAMLEVVPRMRDHIEERRGVWWVRNPVNPEENFADKWAEQPRKAELFFEWLDALEQEYKGLVTTRGFLKIEDYLRNAFGRRDAEAALARRSGHPDGSTAAAAVPLVITPRKSNQPKTPKTELPSRPSRPWSPKTSHG